MPKPNTSQRIPIRFYLAQRLGRSHLNFRGKDRLLRILCHPDSVSDFPFEINFFGLRYCGNLADYIDWCVFFYGAYSVEELNVLSKMAACLRSARHRVIYLDVGVNVGHHLLFMTRHADECYGIDPLADVLERAREKLQINSANAQLFNVGLGNCDEVKTFFPSTTANHAIGSFVRDWTPGSTSAVGYPLQIRRGSDFLAEHGIQHSNVVKIDVEGFEAAVLEGLSDVFRQYRPFILLEMSKNGARELGSRNDLESCLYERASIFEFAGQQLKPYRFDFSRERVELAIIPEEYAAAFASMPELMITP
ncbi:MAG TPA: FkbM family methyltransferase [Candidatus Binataceae bacterium]|nr:FkbM family methyltransferase [Candidatus Binataceae bacterium]